MTETRRALAGTGILLAAVGLFIFVALRLGTLPTTEAVSARPVGAQPATGALALGRSVEPRAAESLEAPGSSLGRAASGTRMALAVNEMGFIRPFGNGERVLTTGPFALRIRFDPFPPVGATDLDITVLAAENEQPVADAAVVLRWDMPSHGHGSSPVRVPNRGYGHYGLRVNLNMAGDWTFEADVRRGSEKGTLSLIASTPGQ